MLRQRGKYWHAVFRLEGKLRWASTRCEKEKDALAVHEEIRKRFQEKRRQRTIARLLGEKIRQDKPLSLKNAVVKYCKLYPNYSPSGVQAYGYFMEWHGIPSTDIGEIDVDTAVRFLNVKGKTSGKWHNNLKSGLSQIWRQLKPYSNIEKNIWLDIPNRPTDPENFRPFSIPEVKELLKKIENQDWKDAIMISLYTGLRRKSVFRLLKEKIVDNCSAIQTIPEKTGKKHRKAVYIPIHKMIMPIIRRRLAADPDSPYMFGARHATYNSGAFVEKFNKAMEAAGIEDTAQGHASFHSLRATLATQGEEQGIPTKVLMGILGHGSPAMTARYNHDKKSAKVILRLKIL
jgi:integrase